MKIAELAIWLGLVALAGCGKDDLSGAGSPDLCIRLGADIALAVQEEGRFVAGVAGWEVAPGGTPDYGVSCNWFSTISVAVDAAAGDVALSPLQNYNPDDDVKTYMKAWYPAGKPGVDGTVVFGDMPNGATDVLLASAVSGSRDDDRQKVLNFNHCLCQLRFRVAAETPLTYTPVLEAITVKGAQIPTGLDLKDDEVLYAGATELPVAGIDPGTVPITPEGADAGYPLLVRPFDGNTFVVEMVTSQGRYPDVTVTVDDATFRAGKVYTITLIHGPLASFGAAVAVTPWVSVKGDDGIVWM